MIRAGSKLLLACCAGALLMTACGQDKPGGSMRVVAATRNALVTVDSVTVQVLQTDGITVVSTSILTAQSGVWEGLFVLPIGSYNVTADAYSAGAVAFHGESDGVNIAANATTMLAMILQDQNPPPAYNDNPPLITSLEASTDEVPEGGSVTLTAQFLDPDPSDTLTYGWTQTSGDEGNFDATTQSGTVLSASGTSNSSVTTWTAPADHTADQAVLQFSVDDGNGGLTTISVAIGLLSATGFGSAQVSVFFNDPPIIQDMQAGPNQAPAGSTFNFQVDATDPNGDTPLAYDWSVVGVTENDICIGTFLNANAGCEGGPQFCMPTTTDGSATQQFLSDPSDMGSCAFTVAVNDLHGGVTHATTTLIFASGANANPGGGTNPLAAPQILATAQTLFEDFAGAPLLLTATASTANVGATGLEFKWSVPSPGQITAAPSDPSDPHPADQLITSTNATSSILWTPPACDGTDQLATVTVTDNVSHLSATANFSLQTCASSCADQKRYESSSLNGYYMIDADGPNGNPPARTYCDDMGSGGGTDFTPSADVTLAGGVNRFHNIHISTGVTVRIDPLNNNGVLQLYATGDVLIDGTIDVSGAPGANGPVSYPTSASLWVGGSGGDTGNPLGIHAGAPSGPPISPGEAGGSYSCVSLLALLSPGLGGGGTAGGNGVAFTYCGTGGLGGSFGGGTGGLGGGGGGAGWAGGAGGAFLTSNGGAGGGVDGAPAGSGPGGGGNANDANYNGGSATAGAALPSGGGGSIGSDAALDLAMLTTFRPGSAGGGGAGVAGAGGGGAGGAVRIVSPTVITISASASILANGGNGGIQTSSGFYYNPSQVHTSGGFGGGGSGGAIYLSAATVNLSGTLAAVGGQGGSNPSLFSGTAGSGGAGGLGRIRIASDNLNVESSGCQSCRHAHTDLSTPTLGGSITPSLPGSYDGTSNNSGLAFVSARYPYELVVTANTPNLQGASNNEYHLAAGSQNQFAWLAVDQGFSLIIDPPTDCTDPDQLQMTGVQVSGDVVIEGSFLANESPCPTASYTVPAAAQAMGAPASVTIAPGANGGYGGNGGGTYCDGGGGCGIECGVWGGAGPSGRNGGYGGSRANGYGWCGPRSMCGCHYDYFPAGGTGGQGSGQPLFLKIAGSLTSASVINASGDSGTDGTPGYPAICDGVSQATGSGAGGGGAAGAGGYLVVRVHGDSDRDYLAAKINVTGGTAGRGGAGSPGYGGANYDCYGNYFGGGGGGTDGDSASPGVLDLAAY